MTSVISNTKITRRGLFVKGGSASAALALGFSLPACTTGKSRISDDGVWAANAWLEINADGAVEFTLDRVEMGQGTYTGLTTLIAEELDQDPESINITFAGAKQVYRNPDYGLQITGGSNSLSSAWQPIRQAAASARDMLLAAAAQVWGVKASETSLQDGVITNALTAETLRISDVISLASKQAIPDSPELKDAAKFKYIGKYNKRLDALAKVQGSADFGIDSAVDNMVYALVVRPNAIGAKLVKHNGADLSDESGFVAITEIDSGLAVVANSYWAARKIARKLEIEWAQPEILPSTQSAFELYRKAADEAFEVVREEGSTSEAYERSSNQTVELEFELPFLAHATMEPMNCVAHIQEDRADIWASTQGPDIAQVVVAKATHLDLDQVHIHSKFIGGGFGRRLNQDYIGEAAEISKALGQPVKLVWSREDDMKNDFYRPASLHRVKASLSEAGEVAAWNHHVVGPGVMDWYVWDAAPAMFPFAPKFMYPMLGKVGLATQGTPMTPADRSAYEGADDLLYEFASQEIRYTKADVGIPSGYWRSVGHSHNGFVTETFIDVLAHQSKQDELAFRLSLLKQEPRLANVLKLVAHKGAWGKPTKSGVFQGIAAHKSFGSYVAELVELSIESGQIKVHKVVSAIDCGMVVNPDIVTMQMESCIVFGLTAALYGEIVFEDGQAQQSNFHDYQMVRNNECPEIEVHIVDSTEAPTGVGEPGLPPFAAAMGGAIFKATGKRHTRLPFKLA